MKYYSDKIRKFYDTEEECVKAEKAYTDKLEAEERKKQELAAQRKTRAKEVEDARTAAIEAQKNYKKLVNDFCKDYGSFHFTYGGKPDSFSIWDLLL